MREKMYELFIEYNSHYAVICDNCFSDTPEEHTSKIYGLIDHLIANGVTIEAEPHPALWHKLHETKLTKTVECTHCNTAFRFKKDGAIIVDKFLFCPACGSKMKVRE